MKTRMTVILLLSVSVFLCYSQAQEQVPASSEQETVRLLVQGDSSRLPDFVESCRREFLVRGMKIQLVGPSEAYEYNMVIAQESSVSGAAAAVVVMDRSGRFVASVVRSGRWSGKGAFNASAKELAKKVAVLRNH